MNFLLFHFFLFPFVCVWRGGGVGEGGATEYYSKAKSGSLSSNKRGRESPLIFHFYVLFLCFTFLLFLHGDVK